MGGYLVYGLCTLTSTLCAVALLIQYRQGRSRLVLWSGLCFVGFALNNLLLIVDFFLGPSVDLSVERSLPALAGLAVMIWAFIRETT